jgi:hypothetical protein
MDKYINACFGLLIIIFIQNGIVAAMIRVSNFDPNQGPYNEQMAAQERAVRDRAVGNSTDLRQGTDTIGTNGIDTIGTDTIGTKAGIVGGWIKLARAVDAVGMAGTFVAWVLYHGWLIYRISSYLAEVRSQLPPPILTGAQANKSKKKLAAEKEKQGTGSSRRRSSIQNLAGSSFGRSQSVFGSAMLGGRAQIPGSDDANQRKPRV